MWNDKRAKGDFRNEIYMALVIRNIDEASECDARLFWKLVKCQRSVNCKTYQEIIFDDSPAECLHNSKVSKQNLDVSQSPSTYTKPYFTTKNMEALCMSPSLIHKRHLTQRGDRA